MESIQCSCSKPINKVIRVKELVGGVVQGVDGGLVSQSDNVIKPVQES